MARVRTGLDRLAALDPDVARLVRGRRVGLVAHPASLDASWRHAIAVVEGAGAELAVLFGPEHGLAGEAQDMVGVASERSGARRIRSLYGERFEDLSPTNEDLDGLDAIVVDLQDVGVRYYTFVWTAALVLRAASARGIETIVLDRPNPLGGTRVEGAPQRPGYRSFVGLYDVAVRHGLTIGELARWVAREERIDRGLTVVAMEGWSRAMCFDETGLPWVFPSPNMPTLDTARVYPGGCLVEGTTLSEGRGTTRPFETWGAPGLDGRQLAVDARIDGAVLRPLSFQPTFHKHAGQPCGGVQVHVVDDARFEPYASYAKMLAAAHRQLGGEGFWRTAPYEFVADRPAIDLLTGGPEIRAAIDRGEDVEACLAKERAGAVAFDEARREVFLYPK